MRTSKMLITITICKNVVVLCVSVGGGVGFQKKRLH